MEEPFAKVTTPWTPEGKIIRALMKRLGASKIELSVEELTPPERTSGLLIYPGRDVVVEYHEEEQHMTLPAEDIVKGDYVLATLYADGDPKDPWCIGFYHGANSKGLHYVIDGDGKNFRAGGFRRIAKISRKRGDFILKHKEKIEDCPYSMWYWKRVDMQEEPTCQIEP